MEDREYLNTMAELKFISQVGDDEFLNTKTGTIEAKNWITSAIRALRFPTENGKCAAEYCRNIVLKGIILYENYKETEYEKTIRKNILDVRDAIGRLKKTHATNTLAFTLFEAIQVCIDQHLKQDI
jgi:hypothetical protein